MQIKFVTNGDISKWESLSSEYDGYVKELVNDLTEWYEGNGDSLAFSTYMKSKITKQEALIAFDSSNSCMGIIAFSKKNNYITFFGISHSADFNIIGKKLILYAFKFLDVSRNIYVNKIASNSNWIEKHRKLYESLDFVQNGNSYENGIPVNIFVKSPSIL